jgi:hypothetical protein
MSLASVYAASVAAAAIGVPPPFSGPGGVMTASVDANGNCVVQVGSIPFTVPPASALAFATWAQATFT